AGGHAVLDFALDATLQPALHLQADWAGTHWQAALQTPAGTATCALALAGRHNLKNALAAAACALAAGAPLAALQAGLQAFEPVKGRSQIGTATWQGRVITLVDDSYNANPDSVRAAIDVLAELPGPRWLLLGDMGEVGDQGPAFHAEIGRYAAERGIERFWTAGTLAAHAAAAYGAQGSVRHHAGSAELVAALQSFDAAGDRSAVASVLVKGSRFMKMEQAVAALRANAAQPAGQESVHAG
ncbi:MAG: UDP-N-acetylmuramoyl-tripeptide--D-alanyl-D-alanine ligase, partial [Pseudomonadota bacterium]